MKLGEVRLSVIEFSDGRRAYFEDPVMAEVCRSLLEKALETPGKRPTEETLDA